MKSRGFTLIELLVVISIISLLSTVILASVNTAREKGRIGSILSFEASLYHARGDALIRDFSFDNTLLDRSGNTTPSVVGTVSYSSDTPNNRGSSINFNGSTYLNSTTDVSETSYVVGFWFKTSTASTGLFDVNGGGNDRNIYITNGNICARLWPSGDIPCTTGANYADGQWHYLLHTYGGATGAQEIWVDGKRIVKGTASSSGFDWQTAILIGYSSVGTPNYFTGLMDNLRIYSTSFAGD